MGKYLIGEKKVNRNRILLFFLAFVFVNCFTYYFISRERYVYFWDYYLYWSKYRDLGTLMMHSPLRAFSEIWRALRHDDYNLMPVFFLMPFRLLFGPGRLAYILAISNTYVLPSAILCTVLLEKLASPEDRNKGFLISSITLSTFLLFPQFWIPVFFGYPAAAGEVVIFIILLILWRNPVEEMPAKNLISLGILLALVVMLRRWYAYWVVAFFMAVAAEMFFSFPPRYRFRFRNYFPLARNLIFTGMVSVSVFFLAATPIAIRMLTTNYGDIYSAYKSSASLYQVGQVLFKYFGLSLSVLFIAGILYGLFTERTRLFFAFLTVQFVLIVVLFSRVQDFNPHHLYLLMPSMIVAISVLIAALLRYAKKMPFQLFLSAGYITFLAIQFIVVFIPGTQETFKSFSPYFTSYRHFPLVRNDLGQMQELLGVLREISHDGKQSVYVISSSIILNDDILRNACRDFENPENFCNGILHASQVDKVHGFPQQFLTATYVVVAEPIQYHLRPEDQRVVGVLAEDVIQAKGIGAAFTLLPYRFTLDNNVKVRIFKKVRPFERRALQDLQERFLNYYPEEREMFTIREK